MGGISLQIAGSEEAGIGFKELDEEFCAGWITCLHLLKGLIEPFRQRALKRRPEGVKGGGSSSEQWVTTSIIQGLLGRPKAFCALRIGKRSRSSHGS
ncbi:hypothetical protein DJ019_03095 [Phenylobacterium kunshanense]|uniref:Uncharacterized protein n=1 Tax=Phenylobacterium kunshanense TaxID=1445034 RepID=A0A328BNT4_9CAUL|nr:hypothetical protein DJ019_03095 [Phenylobacterium kunshanense]